MQEVSGVYTSPFHDIVRLKMALRARNVSGPFEKRAPGAIIGDGDRKTWDPRAPMIWDNFSMFRTNCAILTSYIHEDPRTCRRFSRGCCHVALSNGESCEILLQTFRNDGIE